MDDTTTQDSSIQLNVNMPSSKIGDARRQLADIMKRSFRSRLMTALFGEQHEVVIILPSRNVDNITFTRAGELEGGTAK